MINTTLMDKKELMRLIHIGEQPGYRISFGEIKNSAVVKHICPSYDELPFEEIEEAEELVRRMLKACKHLVNVAVIDSQDGKNIGAVRNILTEKDRIDLQKKGACLDMLSKVGSFSNRPFASLK